VPCLRGLFGAENPHQTAECADDEVYRAEQQRNIDAFGRHQSGISEGQPMVASRTPQPAIEIGSMVISITGGISWKSG